MKEKENITNHTELDKEEEDDDEKEQDVTTNLLLPFSKLFTTTNTLKERHTNHLDIIHNKEYCMFLINLDTNGNTAALCYLPTRVRDIIEIYHTEIPISYRNKGIGDKLVKECLRWAKQSGKLIIPTCRFVQRHLEQHEYENHDEFIIKDEKEAYKKK
ncbi:GCN5-related N-acetyl-transferase-domain-containing protein [Cokeromyces recurvatus]|uniref:GCN5-related N-acetyl-transferase-domain-containing protein n=1 Tax=Cokeromyces recurvatus TaxID=90255 RepID=UPI00221E41EE|nr:GCN5-related N-acetyl-transferase-domain-containing protein [Cokeromyces recurvatus]KAI7903456.1 GCN5-related N-acetyl-transferase-domain-containing protein [Cokeromyces recurvatus]